MPIPSDPNKVILKNSTYPNGITAQTFYDYYINNQNKILDNCRNKKVLLFLSFDPTQSLVVKRNHNGMPIYLKSSNYDVLVNGHLVSISKEINSSKNTNSIVIDIDPVSSNTTETQLKGSVNEMIEFFKVHNTISSTSLFASAKGYHLYLKINKSYKVNELVARTQAVLKQEFETRYFINQKVNSRLTSSTKFINLDLSPMYYRGSLTVPYSLTRIGTICLPVVNLTSFDRNSTILKGI